MYILDTDTMLGTTVLTMDDFMVGVQFDERLEVQLLIDAHEDAFMVTMTAADIEGVRMSHGKGTARVTSSQGLVNFITQQLPTVQFTELTLKTLDAASRDAWREPSEIFYAIAAVRESHR